MDGLRWLAVVIHYRAAEPVRQLCAALTPLADVVVVDNSGDLHDPPAGVDVLRPGTNLGYGGAVNAAVRARSGRCWDALLVATQDVRADFAGFLTAAAAVLAQRPQAGLLGPSLHGSRGVWSYGGLLDRLGRSRHRRSHPGRALVPAGWLDGALLVISRDCWDRVGPMPEVYWLYKEDAEYGLRARRQGITPLCLVDHRAAQQSSRFCHYLGVRNRILFNRRNYGPAQQLAALGWVLLRTGWLAARHPAGAAAYVDDLRVGLRDGRTGDLDARVYNGGVRRRTLAGPDG